MHQQHEHPATSFEDAHAAMDSFRSKLSRHRVIKERSLNKTNLMGESNNYKMYACSKSLILHLYFDRILTDSSLPVQVLISLMDGASNYGLGETKTPSIPTIILVCAHAHFDSCNSFKDFIQEGLKALPFDVKIVDESISLSPANSKCLLQTETKSAANLVKKTLHKLQLETKVRLTCDLQKDMGDTVTTVQQAAKTKMQNNLSDALERINVTLQTHQDKIICLQKEIEAMKSNEMEQKSRKCEFQFDDGKIRPLTDKLEELQMQKIEFKNRSDVLLKDLEEMDTSSEKTKEINSLLKNIGIECNRLRNALPIYARRREIIEQVNSNQVSIILGETGSGKSTQMAQYFYDADFATSGTVVCTQPRRVAATTLAERVANEMAGTVGGLVGYKAGSMTKANENTKIMFITDSGLLNECLLDADLNKYSCIIVDEAHERNIYTDILLGMIKTCLKRRPELKLIITSATIDPKVFIHYFQTGPELRVSGRNFPVDVVYSEDASEDFENHEKKAVSKAIEVHCNEGPGDILVFLCSPVEIMRCCEEFEKQMSGKEDFKCLPLHGQLPPDEQKKVFDKLPEGQRKIVFSTNCAETSITIDGIKFVIDSGVAKEVKYDPKRNISQLGVFMISKSSADQRKGRAGRTASGTCYRLYSEEGFNTMESINVPEILRVHLGQAVLKLAELGINIQSYDFVQAPSEIALKSAIDILHYLGAMINNKITDLGKWISKLPFEPKLGFLVYKAEKLNLLYDAVVLAAVLSTGSDLFYRGFTETEAQVVAKSKSKFSSEHGDAFTWFDIYKNWRNIEGKKEQFTWCHDQSINSKSISFAHQSIKEVKNTLSKDLKINMIQTFSTDAGAMDQLRKIIFEAYADSLCNFSGLKKSGYFCLDFEHHVYVHPSSILCSQDMRPEWIVFNGTMKTSKEFIKGITNVEEEWVHELVNSGRLNVDLSMAQKQKMSRVYHEEVGPSILRAIVGPRFSNIKVIEEELSNSGMPGSVLNVTRDLGTVDIHSSHAMTPAAMEKLQETKSSVSTKLMSEQSEFKLKKNSSAVRVVLGCGGSVKNFLLPDQSNRVIIKRKSTSSSEETVKEKFKRYGEIINCVPFKDSYAWGYICYGSASEASAAVQATSSDEFDAAELMFDKEAKNGKDLFSVKMTWTRRHIKGKGTAFIQCDPVYIPSLAGQDLILSGRCTKIQISKKDENVLVIFNTGTANETQIKEEIDKAIKALNIGEVTFKVSLDRLRVPVDSLNVNKVTRHIADFLTNHVPEESFTIRLMDPKPASINFVGFINFNDPVVGYPVCQEISNHLRINHSAVEISPCLTTRVLVSKRIKEACATNFDQIFAQVAQEGIPTPTWKELKQDFAIEIKSSQPENAIYVRNLFNKELAGKMLNCSKNTHNSCLLTKYGLKLLETIERDTDCLIVKDCPKEKIHLYGSHGAVTKALQGIDAYLKDLEGKKQGCFSMKGHGKPAGFLKLAITTYGTDLERLVDECKLNSINVNWKNHDVQLIGSETAISKANQVLDALQNRAWEIAGKAKDALFPDCSVCLCSVDRKESLYRMEVCGHAYCMECLQHQMSFAVNNKDFPITCSKDGCSSPFVLKDLKFALSKEWIDEEKLTCMALNVFVVENREKFKFCMTPNCSVIYEVTSKVGGVEFTCPICYANICTTCHNGFHRGIPCDVADSVTREDDDMMAWISDNSNRVKRCPGCKWPIEKIEGCNKMHCLDCHTYFCWLCLETSADEQDCYRHLRHVHGGYY